MYPPVAEGVITLPLKNDRRFVGNLVGGPDESVYVALNFYYPAATRE
jgi:hypothetical protein